MWEVNDGDHYQVEITRYSYFSLLTSHFELDRRVSDPARYVS
jgi:hypothetical protein